MGILVGLKSLFISRFIICGAFLKSGSSLFPLIVLDCWGPSGLCEKRQCGKKSRDDLAFLAPSAANLLHTP